MGEAIEDDVFDFLEEGAAAAVEGEPLFGAELHDTVYRPITKPYGVRVGDCDSDLTPSVEAEEVLEFDVDLSIIIYSLVEGPDRRDRKAARARMVKLKKAVAKRFFDDPSMGGRVADSRIAKSQHGWDQWDSKPYAVGNLVLLVNETGAAQS